MRPGYKASQIDAERRVAPAKTGQRRPGLRHDRLDAPWVIDGAMNRELFDLYIETQLAPTLQPGDVIILDYLAVHRSPRAAAAMKTAGAWFLFLPAYSPDLNPIEMAFAKLKALICSATSLVGLRDIAGGWR